MSFNIKSFVPYISSFIVIVLVTCLYFLPQFQNKVLKQTDLVQYKGMAQEAVEFREKTGEETLWTNSMFGGMPTYQISMRTPANKITYVRKLMYLGFDRPVGLFVFGMIGFYILLLTLGVGPWLALIGSLLFGFSTGHLLLYEAGHVTKLQTIMSSPMIIAGFIQVVRKQYLLGGFLFTLGMAINIMSNHPQMTYYLGMVLGIWFLHVVYTYIKQREFKTLGIICGIFALGLLLAIGSSASRLMTTYEYSKDTMRGNPILKSESKEVTSSSETEGLEWGYAMSWSNGTADLFSSFIAHAVGGGSGEWIGKDSNLAKKTRQRKKMRAPMYFGSLPFTSGPYYFGAIAFFLFVFSMFVTKGPIRYWLGSAVLLTFLLSMGKNFEILNRFLFDYFPLFNKFRTPNSVLSVTTLFIPVGAMLAISQIFSDSNKEKMIKALKYSFGAMALCCAGVALLGSAFFDLGSPGDNQYDKIIKDAIMDDRIALMKGSAWRSLILISITSGLIYYYLKNKISKPILLLVIGVIGVLDLIQIDLKYVNHGIFVNQKNYDNLFQPRDVDKQILKDLDPNFRVFDFSSDPFNSTSASYFHKTIGGAHAAKLQRYQDMIDRHISKNNMKVLNMLNTKYFIMPGEGGQVVSQRNPAANGNAWFVNKIMLVPSANDEIDALDTIDPLGTAVVHNEFSEYVAGVSGMKNGIIELTSYEPNKLIYNTNSSEDQFAVFSEIWYGPDKGWQAYIDDKPVDHIRVNYILRGMKIPKGKHEIRFEFKPETYYTGEKISLFASLLVILVSLIYIGKELFSFTKD